MWIRKEGTYGSFHKTDPFDQDAGTATNNIVARGRLAWRSEQEPNRRDSVSAPHSLWLFVAAMKRILILIVFLFWATSAVAQTDSTAVSIGVQVVLSNSGFGLGGLVSKPVEGNYSLVFDFSVGATNDEREVAFFDRFGQRDVPNKANYLLEIPLHIGFQKRLFRSKIEDNFRPYFQVSGGPVIGWRYPYFDDENGNNAYDSDERTFDVLSGLPNGSIEPGIGASIAIGAFFGESNRLSQGVRIGYRTTAYRNPIALLEPSIKTPSRRIGTPVISLVLGGLTR